MGRCGHNDLDALILRSLLIDGEAFIRIHRNANNPFRLTFEIIDALSIDWTKQNEFNHKKRACVLGIEVDEFFKPTSYFIKKGNSTQYQVGMVEQVNASEIIHLYKKEFPQQVRGIPPLNAILNDIHQLDDYRISELLAAKAASCMALFYERNGNSSSGDFLDQANGKSVNGEYIQELKAGTVSVTPDGYNIKAISPTHPHSGFGEFTKSVLKQAAASLGVSYNKLTKDYENVNFSSLKESSIDENAFYTEYQQFLIDSWKEVELKLFLEAIAVNFDFSPKDIKKLLRDHSWICQRRPYVDPSKEILGDKYALELGVKSPIEVIESSGKDPDEVLKEWRMWKDMCSKYDLDFNEKGQNNALIDPIETKTDEDILQTDRK